MRQNSELKKELSQIQLFEKDAIDKFIPIAKKYSFDFKEEEITMLLQSFNFVPGDQKMSKEDIMKVAKDYIN